MAPGRALRDNRAGACLVARPRIHTSEETRNETPAVAAIDNHMGPQRGRLIDGNHDAGAGGVDRYLTQASEREVHAAVHLAVQARCPEVVFHACMGFQGKSKAAAAVLPKLGRGWLWSVRQQ
jgi:hypothetical protein